MSRSRGGAGRQRWNSAPQARVRRERRHPSVSRWARGSWHGLRRLPAGPLELPRPPLQDPDPLQPPKYCTSEATAGGALLYVAVYSSSQRTAISPGHNPKTRDLSSQSPHNPPICAPSLPTSREFQDGPHPRTTAQQEPLSLVPGNFTAQRQAVSCLALLLPSHGGVNFLKPPGSHGPSRPISPLQPQRTPSLTHACTHTHTHTYTLHCHECRGSSPTAMPVTPAQGVGCGLRQAPAPRRYLPVCLWHLSRHLVLAWISPPAVPAQAPFCFSFTFWLSGALSPWNSLPMSFVLG